MSPSAPECCVHGRPLGGSCRSCDADATDRINAAREEGKRSGRLAGWIEAIRELETMAVIERKLGIQGNPTIQQCADHLREKSDKLP